MWVFLIFDYFAANLQMALPLNAENVGSVGKHIGSGVSSEKKKDSGFIGSGLGKGGHPKHVNSKIGDLGNILNGKVASGSRFDVLNEDVDISLGEGGAQPLGKSTSGIKNRGKVVLIEVTNQNNFQSKRTPRPFSHNSKKLVKKGSKAASKVISIGICGGGALFTKSSTDAMCVNHSDVSMHSESGLDDLDNSTVLRQLHIDVKNFGDKPPALNGVDQAMDMVSNLALNVVGPSLDSFDKVASELVEVLTVIFE
ncbi:hypothetical protein LWI29_016390 [Acer saccharum]|uniref:Uncharacterized protein n=1 Tax=Acer saccharum TaxID=4024 RepID=A0AA39VT49_ACESA|nr:hypothetical protein LWI29_016390 [Acer saccharum]